MSSLPRLWNLLCMALPRSSRSPQTASACGYGVTLLDIKEEVNHISVFDDIFLAF